MWSKLRRAQLHRLADDAPQRRLIRSAIRQLDAHATRKPHATSPIDEPNHGLPRVYQLLLEPQPA